MSVKYHSNRFILFYNAQTLISCIDRKISDWLNDDQVRKHQVEFTTSLSSFNVVSRMHNVYFNDRHLISQRFKKSTSTSIDENVIYRSSERQIRTHDRSFDFDENVFKKHEISHTRFDNSMNSSLFRIDISNSFVTNVTSVLCVRILIDVWTFILSHRNSDPDPDYDQIIYICSVRFP